MKNIIAAGLIALSLSAGEPLLAQSSAGDEAKKAGHATKEAAEDAGDAAKHAGKATAKATKKGAKKVKKAVTGDAHATCVDGSRQAGETESAAAAACASHGGVAKR